MIALACAGDDGAFAEIVRRRQARVRTFMRHLCRESSLGDDLAQQVFLTAWRSLRLLREAAAFDAWLKRIMINTWISEVRRPKLKYAGEPALADFGSVHDTTAERMDLDQAVVIYRADRDLMWTLQDRSYSEIDRATVARASAELERARAHMKAQLEKLP